MGKIVISENVSLDGVIEDPAGVDGFGRGGWVGGSGPRTAVKVGSTRRWAPRLCFWVDGPTSGSPRGGHPGVASWRTG
jgi:hypothetical protein